MKTTEDLKFDDRIRALVYAKSKVGKTFGALTFPRPCVFDFDFGIKTARNAKFVQKYGVKRVMYEDFKERTRSKGGVVTDHNAFDDACKFFDEMMSPKNVNTFDTWIIDTGSTLSEVAANKAIVLLGTSVLKITSSTLAEGKEHGIIVPKIQDYGSERSLTEQFIDMVKGTDKHLLLLCHEREQRDKQGTLIAITPLFTGQGVEAVCLKFDEIWNVQLVRDGLGWRRTLITEPDGLHQVGSRIGMPSYDLMNNLPGIEWSYEAVAREMKKIQVAQEAQVLTQTKGT